MTYLKSEDLGGLVSPNVSITFVFLSHWAYGAVFTVNTELQRCLLKVPRELDPLIGSCGELTLILAL